jgi:hypothetical protein
MKKQEYVLKSFLSAAGVLAYVSAIALLMFNAEGIFGSTPSFLAPVLMMLLLVISATVTGLLVLGKPIHLFLSGFKKEAWILLFATLAWLIVFLAGVIAVLILR